MVLRKRCTQINHGFETIISENKVEESSLWIKAISKGLVREVHQVYVKKGTSPKPDHTMFIKHSTNRKATTLIIYEDGIILTSSGLQEIANLKSVLLNCLKLKT